MNLTGLNAATSTGFSKAQPGADFGASGGGGGDDGSERERWVITSIYFFLSA